MNLTRATGRLKHPVEHYDQDPHREQIMTEKHLKSGISIPSTPTCRGVCYASFPQRSLIRLGFA
ncbi:MAG: hypothetical protein ACK57P_10465, partial [Planctomycetota bacterium]